MSPPEQLFRTPRKIVSSPKTRSQSPVFRVSGSSPYSMKIGISNSHRLLRCIGNLSMNLPGE